MPWFKRGKRKALAKIDLTPVRRSVVERFQWPVGIAREAEHRYRAFLERMINDPKALDPGKDNIDLFWQEHILQTEKYAADCQKVFGRDIHRPPRNTPLPNVSKALQE